MPRKMERGILGYKKDPRNQVLFSFNPCDGDECPSSDSQDSDYLPSDDDIPRTVKTKHKKREKRRKSSIQNGSDIRKRQRVDDRGPDGVKVAKTSIASSNFQGRLPPELWLKIFQRMVSQDGALPFLCRAAKVCRMWHELSMHPSLWETVDLSYGWIKSTDETLAWLANNRLSQCHTVSLSSWSKLTNQGLKSLATNCPGLRCINLSYCKKVTSDGINDLVNNCPCLEDIDLSFMSTDLSVACLKHMCEKIGGNLRHLSIGGNSLKGFSSVLSCIMKSCPNLELFDISNARFSTDFVSMDIEGFQRNCPNMKVIRLTNSKFRATSVPQRVKAESPGFPHLEQLSLAVCISGLNSSIGFDDDFISRMLKTSLELRLLDLRGCTNISPSCLRQCPVTDLLQLHLSQSSVTKYRDLDMVFRKWRHCLTHVDLSWNSYPENLDRSLTALSEGDEPSPLEHLNVAGTSVGVTAVKSVLEACHKLVYINFTSCRSLPRGIKREFSGRKKIVKLREKFEDLSDSELESLSD